MAVGWLVMIVAISVLAGDIGGSIQKTDKKAALYRLLAFLSGVVSAVLLMI